MSEIPEKPLKRNFSDADEAYEALREEYFPRINRYFRLIKQSAGRQDDYALIQPLWPSDERTFMPQTYRNDRDVQDMLLAKSIWMSVHYMTETEQRKQPTLKREGVLAAWRRDASTQQAKLSGFNYVPGGPLVSDGLVNTYRDVSVQAIVPPTPTALFPILDHIRSNICNGRDEYANYLVAWLAHMIQRAAERPGTGIAVIGEQGTGKGLFVEFIKRMLGGPRNANTTASSSDTKNFNAALGNKLLVVFDEATFAGDRHQADFMKKLITEPRIRIEQKGIDAYEVDNFARVFITSNNMTSAVPVALGDRRWLIIECKETVSPALLKELVNYTQEDKNAAYFKHYLETYPLDDFNPKQIPMQDTGFENKLQGAYRNDAIVGLLWDWLTAPDLEMHRIVRYNDSGEVIEVDKPVPWIVNIAFPIFYDLLRTACKDNFATLPGKPAMKRRLLPFGIKIARSSNGQSIVVMQHPEKVLEILKRTSRFDWPISKEQENFITHTWGKKTVSEIAAEMGKHAAQDQEDAMAWELRESEGAVMRKLGFDEDNHRFLSRIFGVADDSTDFQDDK